jgi:hypothetical protein
MVQFTKLGWFIIGVTFGVINIWAHNIIVGFIFGYSFGNIFFKKYHDPESNKNQG